MGKMLRTLCTCFVVTGLAAGCMSADAHRRKADRIAADVIAEYQQKAMGRTEPFTIETPADSLRRRLMIQQELPGHVSGVSSNVLFKSQEPLKISLVDALQFAARNSRAYQTQKESVFSSALDLDLSREAYRNSYSGLLSSMFSGSGSGDNANRQTGGKADSGVSRKLRSGGTLAGKLGLDLVKLLTMDKTSTFGILADASISIPLLKGAGKAIAMEPLTQAERNMVHTIWNFERYKKTFAIDITSSYLTALQTQKQIENAVDNHQRIVDTRKRMEALAEAGRTSQTELDQAKQNELQADNSLVSTKQRLEAQFDNFKTKLGIPTDARIVLDETELTRLTQNTMKQLNKETTKSKAEVDKLASEYVMTALKNRLDLQIVRRQFEDAKRKLNVAKDSLDPKLMLQLSASTRETQISGGTTTVKEDGSTSSPSDNNTSFSDNINYGATLNMDLPWNKTAERAAFRKALIAVRAAERAVEDKEDVVKQELRSSARKIAELRETYLIQELSVALARRRVDSTTLFLEAGNVQIRDLLDAQSALVAAQDQLVAAVVSYHMATLNLQKDLEVLEVDEKGLWRNNENQ